MEYYFETKKTRTTHEKSHFFPRSKKQLKNG